MSGDAVEQVEAEAAETVAPGSVEKDDEPSNAVLLDKLNGLEKLIADTLSSAAHNGTPTPANEVAAEVTEPGNGEIIRDKSPASKPWTHKRILR